MAGVNKVILIGNLGRDPESNTTPGGKFVAKFSLGVSERKDQTEWVNVVCWDKTAENVVKYCSKGRQVYVEGRLQTRSWEKDGVKKYATEVVANQVTFLAGGRDNDRTESRNEERGIRGEEPESHPVGGNHPPGGPFGSEDDIPF